MRPAAQTPAISRREFNGISGQLSHLKATLFAVGCMALFGGALDMKATRRT